MLDKCRSSRRPATHRVRASDLLLRRGVEATGCAGETAQRQLGSAPQADLFERGRSDLKLSQATKLDQPRRLEPLPRRTAQDTTARRPPHPRHLRSTRTPNPAASPSTATARTTFSDSSPATSSSDRPLSPP